MRSACEQHASMIHIEFCQPAIDQLFCGIQAACEQHSSISSPAFKLHARLILKHRRPVMKRNSHNA
eukprot:5713656-Lingulodinium_polyedra.AAC.1